MAIFIYWADIKKKSTKVKGIIQGQTPDIDRKSVMIKEKCKCLLV